MRRLTFSGNIFVGPVVVVGRGGDGGLDRGVIPDPQRFGEFASVEWVRRFLAAGQLPTARRLAS